MVDIRRWKRVAPASRVEQKLHDGVSRIEDCLKVQEVAQRTSPTGFPTAKPAPDGIAAVKAAAAAATAEPQSAFGERPELSANKGASIPARNRQ